MRTDNIGPRIAIAGAVNSTRYTIEALIRHHVNLVGVLALSPPISRDVSGYTRFDDLVAATDIPYAEFENINSLETVELIRSWEPDLLFIVGLSQLVKQELLHVPRLGCIGFHPTILPEGRGRAPVAWLVLDNKPGAATFFVIAEGIDNGPILVQETFSVSDQDTATEVTRKLEVAIDGALDRWLPRLLKGEWCPTPQLESYATYNGRRAPEDGLIDWSWPAQKIDALVRATTRPHPGAYTYLGDRKLIIWRTQLERNLQYRGVEGRVLTIHSEQGFLIQTGEGLIWLSEIEPVGKPHPSIRVGTKLGLTAQDEIHSLRRQVRELAGRISELEHQLHITQVVGATTSEVSL